MNDTAGAIIVFLALFAAAVLPLSCLICLASVPFSAAVRERIRKHPWVHLAWVLIALGILLLVVSPAGTD